MQGILQIQFMLQLLLAELIYLFPAEKRSYFLLRFPAAVAVCLLAAYMFLFNNTSQLYHFFRYMILFTVSTVSFGFCFKLPLTALISSCTAGYATQHIAFHLLRIITNNGSFSLPEKPYILYLAKGLVPYLIIYLVFFLTIGLYSARHECLRKVDMRFNALSIAIVFLCIGLSRVAGYYRDMNAITLAYYAIAVCAMALVVQLILSKTVELQYENNTIHLLWKEDRRQYELSKKTIDTINIKYHDLKHILKDLNLPKEEADAIKGAVRVYGSRLHTGNEALDVLLTENTLRLSEDGILLTYTGNGEDFCFMSTMDVYTLFGNAINNAVEAVRQLSDPEKKVIEIVTERHGNLVNVRVSNMFEGDVHFEDGIPVSTKKNEAGFHGFGMKSMKLVAEKYGGSLSCAADGDIFDLSVYLMQTPA
ncbi:MAG: sensor histidine kinase [Lachnospiraceae bacterium]|nr:sensor histidine kinase [Lachnospiraceae bacterium]